MNLTQKETDHIADNIRELSVEKGHIILSEGQSASSLYFVHSGCLRIYFIDNYGKEYTLQFAADGWLADYTAFLANGSTVLNIECLQDTIMYQLPKKNLENLCKSIPQIEIFFRHQVEDSLANFQKRLLSTMVQSAQERYTMFMMMYPNIYKMIKNYHVASYLGITPESLSRVKKNSLTKLSMRKIALF
jgi:CRP-like cAMP-binding protein